MLTEGAMAVNHFASFWMSIELLQPVPEAMGELPEYTGIRRQNMLHSRL